MSLCSYSTVSCHCKHLNTSNYYVTYSIFQKGKLYFLSELHVSSELGTSDDVCILASFSETGKMIHFQGEM